MTKAVTSYAAMLGLTLVVFLLSIMLLSVDTNARHPEAAAIRTHYRKDTCEGAELYFAPARGTVLVLCGLPGSTEWGGLIYRLTKEGGMQALGEDAYEVTVFSATRKYWDRVIVRDSYVSLGNWPSVARLFREWQNY